MALNSFVYQGESITNIFGTYAFAVAGNNSVYLVHASSTSPFEKHLSNIVSERAFLNA